MKTAVILILAIAAQAVGNVCLSIGMKEVTAGSPPFLLEVFKAMENPTIWIGTIFSIAFFLLYSSALSWADLSFILPATSFGYVVNVACGHYFLHEPVNLFRWAGSFVIILGVVMVSRSRHQTIEARETEMQMSEGAP